MSEPGVPVAFRTLGCKVNRVESDAIAAELIGRGAVLAEEDEARVIVINTCTVTGEADAKARKAVRQALKAAGRPVVVVTGCLAALDAAALREIDPRVVVEADKGRVAALVADALALSEGAAATGAVWLRAGEGFRTRAMLKIEDGCDNFCSYCIVPYARGVPRGVPLADLIDEARALVAAGVREIVLTGINIGRYRDAGADLTDVVCAIASTGVPRLRLSSIEPPDLTPRLLAALSHTPAVCEHLHVPLQSGSDEVLSAMGRAYTTQEFAEKVAAAREAIPGLAVSTDVIAGFPGETPEQHAETLAFVERIGFTKLHVFRYSERPGTPAAALPQLAPEVRAARAAELRQLGDSLRERDLSSRAGDNVELLVEAADGDTATGTTREHLRLTVSAPGAAVGDVVVARLGGDPTVR